MITARTDKYCSSLALALLIGLMIMQLAVTLLTNGFVLSFDEAMWHYIGRNWFRHHLIPYHGGADNKSPLIFAIFGLSDILFGVNYWFSRVIGVLCSAISIFYVYKIARYVAGERAGILAMSFFGLSLLWIVTGGRYVSFTETYDVLFIILAVYNYLIARENHGLFISGFLAGIGFGFRLSAVWGIATLFAVMIKRKQLQAWVFSAGVASSVALLILICVGAGIDLKSLWVNGFADNFGSGSTTDHALLWKVEIFVNKFFYSELLSFYPFLIGYIFIKKKVDLYLAWLISEFIGLMVVGTFGALHLKEILAPLSLVSAFFVEHLVGTYNVSYKKMLMAIWILFFPKLIEPLTNFLKLVTYHAAITEVNPKNGPFTIPDEETRKKLGIWVKEHTTSTERVYVAGFGAQVQVYSERISPTIYFNATQTKLAKETLFADLKRNKPSMILVPLFPDYQKLVSEDMRKYVDDLVASRYKLLSRQYSYNVYCLK